MDALSEVLKAVKLDSAFFYNAEFSAPWSFRSPKSCKLAPYINQSSGHVIVYHLLIEGRAYARLGMSASQLFRATFLFFPTVTHTVWRADLALTP
jgi:Cupin